MAVFQVLFGLAVFAVTRDHYRQDLATIPGHPPTMNSTAPVWPDSISESNIARLTGSTAAEPSLQSPADISRRADEFFSNKQYDKAAELYERLLAFGGDNAEVHNNLGLTLHYLGRSAEALERLNEGVVVDPDNQRIWLTLGFVNGQLGNTEQARTALTAATQIGNDESIRQSAMKMLENLP
ncbi:MAG: tetratricopeptide repeat protein [Gammaproteobacteria bacterium]|nr:tetratricopeptide repeat protein [Gammaproteobacteria bacterium]